MVGDCAQQHVIPYLAQNKKITHLDAIVLTHEYWGHIDGLIEVLKNGGISVDIAYDSIAYDSGFPIVRDLKIANTWERNSISAYLTQVNNPGKSIKHLVVRQGT